MTRGSTASSRAHTCRMNGSSAGLTLNYGARLDVFDASFDNEHQLSPRVNLIYEPTGSTTLHVGVRPLFHAAAG